VSSSLSRVLLDWSFSTSASWYPRIGRLDISIYGTFCLCGRISRVYFFQPFNPCAREGLNLIYVLSSCNNQQDQSTTRSTRLTRCRFSSSNRKVIRYSVSYLRIYRIYRIIIIGIESCERYDVPDSDTIPGRSVSMNHA